MDTSASGVSLDVAVYDLAACRAMAASLEAVLANHQAEFDIIHSATIMTIRSQREAITRLEKDIRGATYSAEDRHPAPGLSVKEVTTLTYDEARALEWAMENKHGNLLSLVRRSFERVAEGLRLPFVTVSKIPTVTIARDLTPAAAEIAARWEGEREVQATQSRMADNCDAYEAKLRAEAERWLADEERLAEKAAAEAPTEAETIEELETVLAEENPDGSRTPHCPELSISCGWCGADLGTKPGDGVSGTTTGICGRCAKNLCGAIRPEGEEHEGATDHFQRGVGASDSGGKEIPDAAGDQAAAYGLATRGRRQAGHLVLVRPGLG